MATFLDHFGISPKHPDVDFLNLDLERDTKSFIDSYYLTWSANKYCTDALKTQKVFMQELMDSLKTGNTAKTTKLCSHFPEPKCTGIGLSAESYNGRGSRKIKVSKIVNALKKSKAASTGLLEDLEELILVTRDIGADTISDITTNICMKHFAEYTLKKCKELGIPVKQTNDEFYYFCHIAKAWKKSKFYLPHVPLGTSLIDSPIVLLPMEILDDLISYNSQYFFTNTATDHFVKDALNRYPTASFIYSLKSTGEKRVKLKELRRQHPEYRGNKENIDTTISKEPSLLKKYRSTVAYKRYKDRK